MFVIVWNMGHHGMVTDFSVIMNYKTIVTMVGNNKKGFDLKITPEILRTLVWA